MAVSIESGMKILLKAICSRALGIQENLGGMDLTQSYQSCKLEGVPRSHQEYRPVQQEMGPVGWELQESAVW